MLEIRRYTAGDWPSVWQIIEPVMRSGETYAVSSLVEILGDHRLRIECFDTHDTVPGFTGAARIYER